MDDRARRWLDGEISTKDYLDQCRAEELPKARAWVKAELERRRQQRNAPAPCAFCGKEKASGYAFIGDLRYCHGNDDPTPTCYTQALWDRAFGKPEQPTI
jgi:hypothetical protein